LLALHRLDNDDIRSRCPHSSHSLAAHPCYADDFNAGLARNQTLYAFSEQ